MAYAMFMALVMVLVSGVIGMYIRNKIWGVANKPTNAIEYGRAWAAYMAFIIPMSSIHTFIKKGWIEGVVSLLLMIVVFPSVAFILGYFYGLFKFKNQPILFVGQRATQKYSDIFYEQALNELNSSNTKPAIWARALATSEGVETKAKSIYIQLRVEDLSKESQPQKVEMPVNRQPKKNEISADFLKNKPAIFVVLALGLVSVATFFIGFNSQKWESFYGLGDGKYFAYVKPSSVKSSEYIKEFTYAFDFIKVDGGTFKDIFYVEKVQVNCLNGTYRYVDSYAFNGLFSESNANSIGDLDIDKSKWLEIKDLETIYYKDYLLYSSGVSQQSIFLYSYIAQSKLMKRVCPQLSLMTDL